MFTKSRDWRRWSGPRTEITAAISLASEVLEQWSGIPSKIDARVSYANQLTETTSDPAALERLHPSDLRSIKDAWIDVKTDSDWWRQRTTEYNERVTKRRYDPDPDGSAPLLKPPQLVVSTVSFRFGKDATRSMQVSVQGPDRTSVEGLLGRLVETLERSAEGPKNFAQEWFWMSALPFGLLAYVLAANAVHSFHLAPMDGRLQWQEIVIPIVALVAAASASISLAWFFPPLELLDTATHSRFRQYRALVLSGLGAIAAGVIATVIYAAVS